FLQDRVRVQLLVRFVRADRDVHAVAEAPAGGRLHGRLVTLRIQLEADLEVRLRVAAVRVKVDGVRDDLLAGLQETAAFGREEIRGAAYFVHRPRSVGAAAAAQVGGPDHVVEHEASADGGPPGRVPARHA